MSERHTFSRELIAERTWPFVLDLSVAAALLAAFYAVIWIAKFWFSSAIPEVAIERSPSHLPLYAFYSTARIFIAYILSLAFAIGYGYVTSQMGTSLSGDPRDVSLRAALYSALSR